MRQGRRVPPAEPGPGAHGLRRPVRHPLHRRQAHLPQAAAPDQQHPAGPRPLHPVPALRALRRPDPRRPLHRPPGPWRRAPLLRHGRRARAHRGPVLRADRALRRPRPGLPHRGAPGGARRRPPDDPRRALPERPGRPDRPRRRARRLRRHRLRPRPRRRPRGPGRLRAPLRLLLLGQHHPDLPRGRPDLREVPLPGPPHGPGLHRLRHRARRLRIRHPRRHAPRRRPAPPGRQRPRGQRGVDHRQGPLRLHLVLPARPPHRAARARRGDRRARHHLLVRRPGRGRPGAGPRRLRRGSGAPARWPPHPGGRLGLVPLRPHRPGHQRHRPARAQPQPGGGLLPGRPRGRHRTGRRHLPPPGAGRTGPAPGPGARGRVRFPVPAPAQGRARRRRQGGHRDHLPERRQPQALRPGHPHPAR